MPEVGAKRSGDHNEADSPKKSRFGKSELRLLLIGKLCGAVVGKGGDIVKSLRLKHNVEIRGLNNHAVNRVLSVVGEREACVAALSDILPLACAEAPFAASNFSDRCNYEINFLVHSGNIGAVIGKGGTKIKEIQEASSGLIKIYHDCLPNSDERVVAIGGDTAEKIKIAINIILDTLSNLSPKSQTILYDPTKDDSNTNDSRNKSNQDNSMDKLHLNQLQKNNNQGIRNHVNNSLSGLGVNLSGASAMLGQMGSGQSGLSLPYGAVRQTQGINQSNLNTMLSNQLGNPLMNQLGNNLQNQLTPQLQNQLQNQLQSRLQTMQNQLGMQSQLSNQLPNQVGLNMQSQLGNQMLSQVGGNVSASNMANNFVQRDKYKDERSEEKILDFGKMHTVTQITVSPEICGLIIGKSGRNIKDIRQTSGAQVEFTGNEKGSKEDRTVTITGKQRQIQVAEQMMMQFVAERNK